MTARLLFLAVVTPLGIVGRPYWRRRLGLSRSTRAPTYWNERGDTVTASDLRRQP